MIACPQCANFGKEAEQPKSQNPIHARRILPPKFQEQELDLGLEIVPEFGKKIRMAREAKGLTAKELAMKIFEKESLLHRIENQGKKPSD
jgi:putative transcription factor